MYQTIDRANEKNELTKQVSSLHNDQHEDGVEHSSDEEGFGKWLDSIIFSLTLFYSSGAGTLGAAGNKRMLGISTGKIP